MSNIQVFVYNESQVRTIQKDGQTWWVLKDVCAVLGISQPIRVAERLDNDEVNQIHLIDKMGRNQKVYVVNESGLYSVILRSDKPEAKPFRKWVTSEVLPEIRKTGSYAPDIQNIIAITVEKTLEQLSKTQMQTEKPIAKKCIGQQSNTWDRLDEITQQTVLGMMQSGNYSSQKISQYIFDATGIYMSQVTVCRYKRRFFSVI